MDFQQIIQPSATNQYVRPDAGGILLQYGLVEEAMPFVEKAYKEMPGNAKAIGNYAIALTQLGRTEEALSYYRQASEIEPDSAMILYNRACSLEELGRFEEAFADFKAAYLLEPTHKGLMHGYALGLLRQGRYAEAWPLWDTTITKLRVPGLPNWYGPVTSEVFGKRFLVLHEGGYGDVFMFWRFLKLLRDAGAHVTYYGLANLQSLLADHPYIDRWLQTPDPIDPAEFDFQTGGMRIGLEPFVPEMPIFKLTTSYAPHSESFNVGVCWDSGEMHAQGRKVRAIPLETLAPLADCPARFFSLQYGAEAPKWMQDLQLGKDWKATADLIARLDLVISVDTAVAHLAGSLGIPTWTLVPKRSDWRWFLDRTDSPWYPSMKLYRNTEGRDWTKVIEQVANDLSASE